MNFVSGARRALVGISQNVEIEVRDARTGQVLSRQRSRNKVVDSGLNLLRDIVGGTGFRPSHIAVGIGTAAPAAGDTALGDEKFRREIDRRTSASKKITLEILISTNDANGFTLSEMGVFQSATLYARALISPTIVKTASIEVTIKHETTFTAL